MYRIGTLFLSLTLSLAVTAPSFSQTLGELLEIRENAILAGAAYNPMQSLPDGWERSHSVKLPNGLEYSVLVREQGGQTELKLSFAGTNDLKDAVLNLDQIIYNPFRPSDDSVLDNLASGSDLDQYDLALSVAESFINAHPDVTVSCTGHSLGGGLCQYVAAITGIKGSIFNAAGLVEKFFDPKLQSNVPLNGNGNITSVRLDGDPVSPFGYQLGNGFKFDPAPGTMTDFWPNDNGFIDNLDNLAPNLLERFVLEPHSIDILITAIDQQIANKLTTQLVTQLNDPVYRDYLFIDKFDGPLDPIKLASFASSANIDIGQQIIIGPNTGIDLNTFLALFPTSTGGFVDITVAQNAAIIFRIFDAEIEDGDRLRVTVFGVGVPQTVVAGNLTITNAGQVFNEQVLTTPIAVEIVALNEGSLSPNTGGIDIQSPVQSGPTSQTYNLSTGQNGVIRFIPAP